MSYENVPKNKTEQGVLVRGARPDFFKLEADAFPVPTADEAGAILEVTDTGDRFRWSSTAWYQINNKGSLLVRTELVKGSFGEVISVKLNPVLQISAQYGLLSGTLTTVDDNSSGLVFVIQQKYTMLTGVASDGLASILSTKQLAYRPGQGALARFTVGFTVGKANNVQGAGLITAENSFTFGFNGVDFGITYSRGGVDELQELTLTVAAGSETAVVTIDGTVYNVTLTGIGTVQDDAFELAVSLSTQVPNFLFTANDDQVVAQAVIPGAKGVFTYSSPGTSVGSWVKVIGGGDNTIDFIPQVDWNIDTKADLNPLLGNVYQIQFQYLGFGSIEFYIEDRVSGKFVLVHRIRYANTSTTTIVTNPTFRVGWFVRNEGNTSNVVITGASAAGFIEGPKVIHNAPRSIINDQLAVGATLTNIVALRNRIVFGSKVNRGEIVISLISFTAQPNKVSFFSIILDPTFSSPIIFEYEDKSESIAEVSTTKVTLSGGRNILTVAVVEGGSTVIPFSEESAPDILPGTVMCIAAIVPSGQPAADCQATITWVEDI